MTKLDKELDRKKISEQRRTDPPPPDRSKLGRGRGRNIEAADKALQERIAADEARNGGRPSFWRNYLPENESKKKAEKAKLKKIKCECEHRGSKHRSPYSFFFRVPSTKDRLHGRCDVCECRRLRPTNALWVSPCSRHKNFSDGCQLCELGTWEVNDD